MWSDNALVRTLSNFHGPVILEAGRGVLQKKRDGDEKRERTKTEVPCPAQTQDYCKTFHLIDKIWGGRAVCNNWSSKLIFWLCNMSLNNAYKMYKALVKQHTPEQRILDTGNAVRELTHNLCQRGPVMRKLSAEHQCWMRDMSKLFGWIKRMMMVQSVMPQEEMPTDNYSLLKNQQQ